MQHTPVENLVSHLILGNPMDAVNEALSHVQKFDDIRNFNGFDRLAHSFNVIMLIEPYDYTEGEFLYYRNDNNSRQIVYNICEYSKYVLDCFLDYPPRYYEYKMLCAYAESNGAIVDYIDSQIEDSLLSNTEYTDEERDEVMSSRSLSDRLDAWHEHDRDWIPSEQIKVMIYYLSDSGVKESDLVKYHIENMSQSDIMEKFKIKGPVHSNGMILVQP